MSIYDIYKEIKYLGIYYPVSPEEMKIICWRLGGSSERIRKIIIEIAINRLIVKKIIEDYIFPKTEKEIFRGFNPTDLISIRIEGDKIIEIGMFDELFHYPIYDAKKIEKLKEILTAGSQTRGHEELEKKYGFDSKMDEHTIMIKLLEVLEREKNE